MKRKLKKAWIVLRRDGFGVFCAKLFAPLLGVFRRIDQKIWLLDNDRILNKLKAFSSNDPREAFRFISHDIGGIFSPMQIEEEFLNLLRVFKETDPKIIMEIGTANGGTLFCFARLAAENALLISVDLPEGKFGGGYSAKKIPFYQAFARPGQDLRLLREDSHVPETLEKVQGILGEKKVDFLFIDGDHSYEGVKKDFEMYSPLVRKGGVVAFHDVAPKGVPELTGGVPRFWKEISGKYPTRVFIKDMDQEGYGIGILTI